MRSVGCSEMFMESFYCSPPCHAQVESVTALATVLIDNSRAQQRRSLVLCREERGYCACCFLDKVESDVWIDVRKLRVESAVYFLHLPTAVRQGSVHGFLLSCCCCWFRGKDVV